MTAPTTTSTSTATAATLYQAQAATAATAAEQIGALFLAMNLSDIDAGWAEISQQVLGLIAAAQMRAALTSQAYQQAVLSSKQLEPLAEAMIDPAGFAGYTYDGREILEALGPVPVWIKQGIGSGLSPERAAEKVVYRAKLLAQHETQRAGSDAALVGRNLDRQFTGFERHVQLPACSRCIVLAGRRYKRNAQFDRHPNCDCVPDELTIVDGEVVESEPSALFRALPQAEQDRIFTKAGARAIRDGADIGQVVNARKGAIGLTPAGARITKAEGEMLRNGAKRGRLQPTRVYGQDVFLTTEGTTVRGVAGKRLAAKGLVKTPGERYRRAKTPRLMPESIYDIAGDDQELALNMLRRFGYIL